WGRWRGTERNGPQGVGGPTAPAKTRHRLHELANVTRVIGGRIGREAAQPPIQADSTQAGESDKGVADNIVSFERAGIDVAQYEVGRAGCVDRSDACEMPIRSHRADEGGAGELIVVDVVDLQPAGLAVAQQQIGFAGHAAEIADARELPIETDRAD